MLFFIGSLLLLLPPTASAEIKAHFTTVFYDDGGLVYVGLKRETENRHESQVITFPFEGGERVRIPLPDEISHRDVVGLIPEKQKVFVLTHKSEEASDGPMLHIFDRKKNSWKKLGQLACPSFTKVKVSAKKMVFYCERPTRKGRKGRSIVAKTIGFGRERLYRYGTWRFPEFMLRYKGVTLLLEGKAPVWDRLRLKPQEGEDRILQAEELFQLPAPLSLPTSATPLGPSAPEPAEGEEEEPQS